MGDLERALSRNTLLIPALFTVSGAIVGLSSLIPLYWGFIWLVSSTVIYIIIIRISGDPIKAYKHRNYHYVWLSIAFLALGFIDGSEQCPNRCRLSESDDYLITGTVMDNKTMTYGDAMIINVLRVVDCTNRLEESSKNLKLKINVIGGGNFQVGDVIKFRGVPELIVDNANSFSTGYRRIMNNSGIFYSFNISTPSISLLYHKNTLEYYSVTIRNNIEKLIEKSGLNKHTQNFLITILLGDRSYLESNIKATFSEAGVTHILALSGMHIAIISSILFILLFPFNFYGKYKIRYVIATLLLWMYAFISGSAPSTTRACIMITFAMVSIISERKNYALNSLSGAVMAIVLLNPISIYDVGFQLSVLCVAALILFSKSMNRFSQRKERSLYKLSELLIATTIATSASWILTCYYYNSFPLAFLPANLILLPILPLYLVFAIIYILFSAIGVNIPILQIMLDKGYYIFNSVLDFIGRGGAIEVSVPYEAVISWILGLVLIALFINLYKWKLFAITGIILLSISIIIIGNDKSGIPVGSFIVTDNYHDISINIKTNHGEKSLALKRYSISDITILDKKLLVLDNAFVQNSNNSAERYDYLIIGGGFKGKITDAINAFSPSTVILHPSIRRKKEAAYIREIETLNLSVHSLRLHDALRVIAGK